MTVQTQFLQDLATSVNNSGNRASDIDNIDSFNMLEDLVAQKARIAVVGLGYVGLPIALEFAKSLSVIGFDIKEDRVAQMRVGIDPSNELEEADFKDRFIRFTSETHVLSKARFYVVAVPTPINADHTPNLEPLKAATLSVAQHLKKGDYVVFESTVFPGCTEEVCLPILEAISGLKCGQDFKIGYSPERINPGDRNHTLTKIKKVVSGCDEEAKEVIANVYDLIIEAGVFPAASIKVAEASKIVENTQRDINIALMNELSGIFENLGIHTHDVLEAAGTKWNFLNFFPGLVGGHCIGVDPYYLAYKAEAIGSSADFIKTARAVNEGMPLQVARRVVTQLDQQGKDIQKARILVKGITFKEDVTDIRNSKAANLVKALIKTGAEVVIEDANANPAEVKEVYGFGLTAKPAGKFDCIILAVPHKEYCAQTFEDYKGLCTEQPYFFDFRRILKNVPAHATLHTL